MSFSRLLNIHQKFPDRRVADISSTVQKELAGSHFGENLKPGARVVASGLKWARPLVSPTNLMVLQAALVSVTSLEGLTAPWSNLARWARVDDIQTMLGRGVFIASATVGGELPIVL